MKAVAQFDGSAVDRQATAFNELFHGLKSQTGYDSRADDDVPSRPKSA
jgi:hypothetical protein